MSHWLNYEASLKILVFGLLLGSGLPALFAFAVKLGAVGDGVVGSSDGTAVRPKNPALTAFSWLIYALVLTAVFIGMLYIARDFIGLHTGWYLLGAKPA